MSQLPDCISMTLSFENVENVVKPPHKPTERKRTKFCETLETRQNRPHSTPMSKHPSRLTTKVAHGNPPLYLKISETTYRNAPPTKLPAPTYRISFHIHYQLKSAAKVQLFSDICKSFANKMYTAKQIVPFWLRTPIGFTLFYAAKTGFIACNEEIKSEKSAHGEADRAIWLRTF